MIDPHTHLRDFDQKEKETLEHAFAVAAKMGIAGLFEMPNTSPPLIGRKAIEERIQWADNASQKVPGAPFHGIFAAVTKSEEQIIESIRLWRELFPRIVGIKIYAGPSTGDLTVGDEDLQRHFYKIAVANNYTGVIAVHAEKLSLFCPQEMDSSNPWRHSETRPEESEVEAVQDQIKFAEKAGFCGVLHICHISSMESLRVIEENRTKGLSFRITCGATPHHLLLSTDRCNPTDAELLKVNPPLRLEETRRDLWTALKDGRIDWLESDHAPHTEEDKKRGASGLPGLPGMGFLIQKLQEEGASPGFLRKITHDAIVEAFNFPKELIPLASPPGEAAYNGSKQEYFFDPFNIYK